MSKIKDGFYKQIDGSLGNNECILLAGGGHKKITSFLSEQKLTGEFGYIMRKYTVDASSFDQNTFYPVIFKLLTNHNTRIECIVALDSGTKPSWSSHSAAGFSTKKIWEVVGNGWGVSDVARRVLVSDCAWIKAWVVDNKSYTIDPVRKLGQIVQTSEEYVYVRGGGKYHFYISDNIQSPIIYREGYIWNKENSTGSLPTYTLNDTNISTISDFLPPIKVTNNAELYWANVRVSATSSIDTSPSFNDITTTYIRGFQYTKSNNETSTNGVCLVTPTLGENFKEAVKIKDLYNSDQGMFMWYQRAKDTENRQGGIIQVINDNNNNTTYPLNLQPFGGAVTIGTIAKSTQLPLTVYGGIITSTQAATSGYYIHYKTSDDSSSTGVSRFVFDNGTKQTWLQGQSFVQPGTVSEENPNGVEKAIVNISKYSGGVLDSLKIHSKELIPNTDGFAYDQSGCDLGSSEKRWKYTYTNILNVEGMYGGYINGTNNNRAAIVYARQFREKDYHPILKVTTYSGHVINLGGIKNSFGFYGFYKDTVSSNTNIRDWYVIIDSEKSDSKITSTLNIKAPKFIKNNSSVNHVLLGDGDHLTIDDLLLNKQLTTISLNGVTINRSWTDVVNLLTTFPDIVHGTYIVQLYVWDSNCGIYHSVYSGVMSLHTKQKSNAGEAVERGINTEEIILHSNFHDTRYRFYLRTYQTGGGVNNGVNKLQMAAVGPAESITPSSMELRFKRII